jgi:hypothetical protein
MKVVGLVLEYEPDLLERRSFYGGTLRNKANLDVRVRALADCETKPILELPVVP